MEKPHWETAAEFFNRVREAVTRVTQEKLEKELEHLERTCVLAQTQQMPNPKDVLIDLIFKEVDDPGEFKIVKGVLGVQPHQWYEWTWTDLAIDPLPQRYIVDPVPLGGYNRPVGWAPNSPFAVLYIKDIDQ